MKQPRDKLNQKWVPIEQISWRKRIKRAFRLYVLVPLLGASLLLGAAYAFLVKYEDVLKPHAAEAKEVQRNIPPVLQRIAKCESGGRQFKANGDVVRGIKVPNDIGKYQINITHNGFQAMKLGYNILTEEGNEKMALWLYENQGTEPWSSSKHCWAK